MSGGTIAIVIVVVIIIAVLIAAAAVTTRRRRLQQQFGPEYERAVAEQNSKLRAEAELTDRQRRVRKLDIKPLADQARRQYTADWAVIQEQFVDSPQTAVGAAHDLVVTVMTERGYPTDDTEQAMNDLSVEHASYRRPLPGSPADHRLRGVGRCGDRGPAAGADSLPCALLRSARRSGTP